MDDGSLRKSGIDLIGDVQWGTHFCQFYRDKKDLIDILVPYFAAGLQNNEFCMWVTAENLDEKEAEAALRQAVPDLDERIEKGQIEIIPHTEWYLLGGSFDQDRVLNGWVTKLNHARARGYDGLRLTGNTFWLEKSEWRDFYDYEAAVNDVIGNYRMISICTYALEKCNASEIADVVVNHQFALMKREDDWTVIESSDYKQAREALSLSEHRYGTLFGAMREAFALHEIICDENGAPCDYRFLEVNLAFETQTGLKASDVIGKTVREILPGIEPRWIDTYGKVALTGEPVQFEDYAETLGKHYHVHAFSPAAGQFATIFMDVTERKRAEEHRQQVEDALRMNEQRLSRSQEIAHLGSWELDLVKNELTWSDEVYRIFGLQPQEFAARYEAFLEAVHPDDRAAVDAAYSGSVHDGKSTYEIQHRVVRKSTGETRWVHERCEHFRDAGGNIIRSIGMVLDITDGKQAEVELRASREDLDRAQAVARTGSWRMNVQRNELTWSDENYRIFGAPIGTPQTYETFLSTIHPDDREYVDEKWMAALRGEPYDIEHRIVVGDTVRWVRETAMLEFDEDGALLGGFGTTQDVSDRKRAEQETVEARADAERRAAELETFIESMGDAVALFDTEGKIVLANDAALRMLGVPAGMPLGEVGQRYRLYTTDGDPLPVEMYPTRRALQGEQNAEARCRFVTPWTEGIVHITASPVRDPAGEIVGVVTISRDVRAQVEFERQQSEMYERERRIADVLQKALIPEIAFDIPGCDIAAKYEPALKEAEVGGDFYDVFDLGDGKIGVLIGDVAGKGLDAAIRVAAARHSIRSYAYLDPRPSRVMALANDALCRDESDMSSMLTAFFAVVDTRVGVVTYASGGHEPPVIRTADGQVEELDLQGRALGAMPGWAYGEDTRLLGPGDILVMVTDGVTESRPDALTLFGLKGVKNYLQQSGDASVDKIAAGILKAAKDHAGGELKDDAAIIALTLKKSRRGRGRGS